MVLVDAGPLVALIHADDRYHLDRRDFEVYRPSRLGRFILLPSRLEG